MKKMLIAVMLLTCAFVQADPKSPKQLGLDALLASTEASKAVLELRAGDGTLDDAVAAIKIASKAASDFHRAVMPAQRTTYGCVMLASDALVNASICQSLLQLQLYLDGRSRNADKTTEQTLAVINAAVDTLKLAD